MSIPQELLPGVPPIVALLVWLLLRLVELEAGDELHRRRRRAAAAQEPAQEPRRPRRPGRHAAPTPPPSD